MGVRARAIEHARHTYAKSPMYGLV